MPTHAEQRRVPYGADDMYALVADIERYPEFLPWTAGCRIRSRSPATNGDVGAEIIEADLIISFRVFRERFGSRIKLHPIKRIIDVEYLDGPFKFLNNHWHFTELEDGHTMIDFFVDFEFKSKILQSLIGIVFNEAMQRIVSAFEQRAQALFSDKS